MYGAQSTLNGSSWTDWEKYPTWSQVIITKSEGLKSLTSTFGYSKKCSEIFCFARESSVALVVVCLYQILPDPGFELSTSPQKGAMTLKVSLLWGYRDIRGNGCRLYCLEGASKERRPFVFTLRGEAKKKAIISYNDIIIKRP